MIWTIWVSPEIVSLRHQAQQTLSSSWKPSLGLVIWSWFGGQSPVSTYKKQWSIMYCMVWSFLLFGTKCYPLTSSIHKMFSIFSFTTIDVVHILFQHKLHCGLTNTILLLAIDSSFLLCQLQLVKNSEYLRTDCQNLTINCKRFKIYMHIHCLRSRNLR